MTDLLLDTHAFLWWVSADERLSPNARDAISSAEHVVVSDVSLWELTVKVSIGKLRLDPSAAEWFEHHTNRSRFRELSITRRHLADVALLPLLHRDPFDRLLIAQARVENLALVSSDAEIAKYDIRTLW
jgi:PIN domain nuclease of toxin-antitoxin system